MGRFNRLTLQLLSLVARVRPDERRDVLGAFATLFAFMAGHALLETARDALFLARLPASRLPWVYLAIAVFALTLGQREPRVMRRLSARTELGRWLFFVALVTSAFWLIAGRSSPWVVYGLYTWSGVLASLVVVRFWTVLGSRFTVTQAKRVFPVIASGSVAGAIVGSAFARALTEIVDARHLVLAAAGMFLLASTAPAVLGGQDAPPPRSGSWIDFRAVARSIWERPYLRRVASLVLLSTVTFTLVDFVFKSAADRYVAAEDLGEFFATVYLSFNVLSLLVQVVLVAFLLRVVGLVSSVAIVPALLVGSTLGFAVAGGITLALVLKGVDGTLRHSLYRTGTELLFVPLSDRLRTQVKGFIDVMGQRGGQAVAAVLILMLLSTTSNPAVFAALACLVALGWLVVAVSLREPYLDLFRETLYAESRVRAAGVPSLDGASLDTLVAALNAPDDLRVLAALDMMEEQGRIGAVPVPMLYHPSSPVVVRTVDLFADAGRADALPMVSRLLGHADPVVRAAALRAHLALAPLPEVVQAALEDADARVAATAMVAAVSSGWAGEEDYVARLVGLARSGGAGVQLAIAAALRAHPSPELESVLVELLTSSDADVLREAIGAGAGFRGPRLVDHLIPLLGRRAVRAEVRTALATHGAVALEQLATALDDPSQPHSVRRHLPSVLASIGSVRAPEILLKHIQHEPDGMIRFKVLRALGRWRREQPSFPLDVTLLQGALGNAVSTAFRLMGWRRDLTELARTAPALSTELHVVLVKLLRDKQEHTLERVFRLLNLQAGSEEFRRVYRALHSPHPHTRAGSRELLQHMVWPPVRRPLMTLVDDLHADVEALLETSWSPRRRPHAAYATVLSEIVACGMESASSLAAAHAAELGLTDVRAAIAAAPALSTPHAELLAEAYASLAEA